MRGKCTSPRLARMAEANTEVPLSITVVAPPPDVLFCVQGKPGEWIDQVRSTGKDIIFAFSVRLGARLPDGGLRFLGQVVQGPPTGRFVYICSGTMAGDPRSCWTRRAKVPLSGITEKLIKAGHRLGVRIAGRAGDGGPACATVPLLGGGWRAVR
jgi:hypothetical protein